MWDSLSHAEALIRKADIKWLAGAILAGGVAAPITLLISLRHTPASTASLLLNFEGVATTLIAVLIFKEAINRQIGWAIALVTTASILLSVNFKGEWGLSLGALGIMAACLLWGLDNNFTFVHAMRNLGAARTSTLFSTAPLSGIGLSLLLFWEAPVSFLSSPCL
jgi:drug/metabolite transporter (DMT)-like permease